MKQSILQGTGYRVYKNSRLLILVFQDLFMADITIPLSVTDYDRNHRGGISSLDQISQFINQCIRFDSRKRIINSRTSVSNKKYSTRGGGGAGPVARRPRGRAAGRGRSRRRRRDEGGVTDRSRSRVSRRKPLGRAVVSSHRWAQWAEAHFKPAQSETAFAAAAKETKRNGSCFARRAK